MSSALNREHSDTRKVVHIAGGGLAGSEAAWQLAHANHPDVMLLDISMPNLDGYELANRVRAQTWGTKVRLIAVSGWLSPEQRARALASGYDAQVNKPIDLDELEVLLQSTATACHQAS